MLIAFGALLVLASAIYASEGADTERQHASAFGLFLLGALAVQVGIWRVIW